MSAMLLEKMLRREDLARLLNETARIMGLEAVVLDARDRPIFGSAGYLDKNDGSHPVTLDGEFLGTVLAGPGSKPLADILCYAARRERERKALSQDCLGRMNEITLLHELSGKLCHAGDPKELSRMIMEATRRLLGAELVTLYLLEHMTGPGYVTYATNGDASRKLHAGLSPVVDKVVANRKPEIVNNLAVDSRFEGHPTGALACAPLMRSGTALGALLLRTSAPREFSSQDLSHLATLANLSSMALEGVLTKLRLSAMGPNLKQAAAALQRLAADIPSGR
ncbi:MAG: GAF domain-containing protein [Oceanidesulfovibrio sp.]